MSSGWVGEGGARDKYEENTRWRSRDAVIGNEGGGLRQEVKVVHVQTEVHLYHWPSNDVKNIQLVYST